jgi:hypothetical protein
MDALDYALSTIDIAGNNIAANKTNPNDVEFIIHFLKYDSICTIWTSSRSVIKYKHRT